jgi:ATP-dependent helicase/nuclease subunit B
MSAFLEEVAEDLVARLGEDLQHATIIFNNKRPAAYLQHHIAGVLKKPFWSPAFYTIQEFFAGTSNLKTADPFTQFFTLFKVYNDLLLSEGQKAMEPAKFYPIARIILSDFTQIDNDLVDAIKLFEELEDIAEIDFQFDYLTEEQEDFLKGFWKSYSEGKQKKQQEQFIRMWRRMPEIYSRYHAALKAKGLISMGQVYRTLAEGKELPDFTTTSKKGKLVFVGFNALTRAEAKIFKRLQDEDLALFYFDTDDYYINDKTQEAGLFLRKNLEQTGLLNALGTSKALIKSSVKTVNVYKTQGHSTQAKILHGALQSDYPLLANSEQAGKVALILADESLLLPVLQTIPTQYQDGQKNHPLNVNVSMGYPLAATSIFGLADLWLSIQVQMNEGQKESVNFKEVEAFLSHPLTGMTERMRGKIQQKLIEEQLAEVPVSRLIGQKGLLALFFTKVVDASTAALAFQDILKYILEKQLDDKSLKQTEADLFVATLKELNRLHDTLTEHLAEQRAVSGTIEQGRRKELAFVLSLIQKAIQGIAVPLSGEPLQGIQVMGLLESRNLDFEHVYILGVNEGILPQTSISTSFIPDSIRRAHGLPVLENQDAISAYMFYRLLQRSEKISLVYNGQTDESNTGEPSRFLRQLEYESGYTFRYFEQQQSIETESRTPVQVEKDRHVMFLLSRYLNGKKRLSATALTAYVNCPLQFFYKYVAGIEEPEVVVENVEANIIGSMLHWVMETFYRNLAKSDPLITKDRIADYRSKIASLSEKAFAQIVFKDEHHAVNHNGMQKVVLAIVKEYADIILDSDEAYAPFKILALEKKDQIDFKFQVQGLEKTITLHGVIDRIDEKDGVIRIVDYKTGADDLRFSSIQDVFDTNGNKQNKALIQTLFYTHVYEQANAKSYVEPNIYSIRSMRNDGPLFMEGRGKLKLSGQRLESIKLEFLEQMRRKLSELFDENIPFTPTSNENGFAYSPYTTLCGM